MQLRELLGQRHGHGGEIQMHEPGCAAASTP